MEINSESKEKLENYFNCILEDEHYEILKILNNAINNNLILREGWLSEEEEEVLKDWEKLGCLGFNLNNIMVPKELAVLLKEVFGEE